MVNIIRASEIHLSEIVPLFEQYRIFYKQAADQESAKNFLRERLKRGQCIIYLARVNDESVGFALLYFTFSSVSLQPYFILNDLYVRSDFRAQGIGELLLEKAKKLCVQKGFKGLALETATDNPAQKLYEKLGWRKDTHCFHYFWTAG